MNRRTFLAGSALAAASALVRTGPARAADVDLDFAPAADIARAIRRGDVSSTEVTAHVLERIKRYNPRLNAIVTLTEDSALERARAADEARGRGVWWGPLHGVPCTIKDTFEVAGVRTTAGVASLAQYVPARDAVVVERYRAAGAVVLGKTNVPEWASDWQSYNAVFGVSSNPWDIARTPGGSSGGEAAALAAGLSYLGVGSDIAGSIRVPAHFCGIYGHKPTLGVVPLRGHIPPPPGGPPGPPPTLPVAGPLARSATDLAFALELLAGPDGDEARAYRWSPLPPRASRLSEYRIGFVLDDHRCPVSPEVGTALRDAVDALAKAGAHLDEGWPPGVVPGEQFDTYLYLLYATLGSQLRDEQLETMRALASKKDGSYLTILAQAWTDPVKAIQAAGGRRMAARGIWQEYFRTHDAFLLPTEFIPAFPHDQSQPQYARRLATPAGPREYYDLFFWISFATLTGLPATTAPVGLTGGGLPVGIQVIGPYLEDFTSIDLTGRIAEVVGGFRPPGGYR
ncbi:MAG TPA: amidase [Candidatus Methylomirabilis sp.]|nr:amidase [Candidatus Methylomirabilis sp.]